METKVIVVQGGEELLAALTKLLGGDIAKQVQGAVDGAVAEAADPCDGCTGCDEDEEDVIPEPEYDFGEVVRELEESEDCFTKSYKVQDAGDLTVTVKPTGVVVSGADFGGVEFEDTIAPNGAYDEVTAYFDDEDETLTVTLYKVPEEGTSVEIDGW